MRTQNEFMAQVAVCFEILLETIVAFLGSLLLSNINETKIIIFAIETPSEITIIIKIAVYDFLIEL